MGSLPLAHNPLAFTYTDASQRSSGADRRGGDLGCGVFRPSLPPVPPLDPADPTPPPPATRREYSFCVPCSDSHIVRGELSAILAALTLHSQAACAARSPAILTDSLVSLQLLHKHIHRPWLTASCPYQPLLQAIVEAAAAFPEGASIRKVRAHNGIRGNEAADALAKAGIDSAERFNLPAPLCPDPDFFVYLPEPGLTRTSPPSACP